MKENWFITLMFSLVFGILGFLLGHGFNRDCHPGHCKQEMQCHGERGQGGHKGECQHMKGQCGMTGFEHDAHGRSGMHPMIEQLKAEGFQGDTSISTKRGTLTITMEGDSVMVRKEMEIQTTEKPEMTE